MKKIILSLVFVFTLFNGNAQNSDRQIIIDVTSTNFKVYQSILLTVKVMAERNPNSQIDVIAYGEAVPMLMKKKSAVEEEIAKYAKLENVTFTACEISMTLFNIKKDQLIEGVRTVENAVVEIAKKQNEGWGYIKSGI